MKIIDLSKDLNIVLIQLNLSNKEFEFNENVPFCEKFSDLRV